MAIAGAYVAHFETQPGLQVVPLQHKVDIKAKSARMQIHQC